MAATYSSFMTTRFYSPVFNTALFDGPLRIYFSQSYESAALKIYHLLQTQHEALWNRLKECSSHSKEHVFLMMYPEQKDLQLVFAGDSEVYSQDWEEGLAVGFCQPNDDQQLGQQLKLMTEAISAWIEKTNHDEITL